MHTLVFALVDADAQDDALTAARTAFDRLVGFGPETNRRIAYYETFDGSGSSPVAGAERVGRLPTAAPVGARSGRALLERAWAETETAKRRRLQRLREILSAHSDAELLCDADGARRRLERTMTTDIPTTALYDGHGMPIQTRDHLTDVLAGHAESWIVPATARV